MTDSTSALAIGVDLGSTAIKAAILDRDGRLTGVESVAAPALRGPGALREGDAEAYVNAVRGVLRSVRGSVAAGTPLGIATQRSTFVLWDRHDGRPRGPMISWQDRRAAAWCDRHRAIEPEVVRRTGLPLSTHYVGPKLAAMQEADDEFRTALHGGGLAFGTLETYLLWRWSAGRRHETDLTVGARTLLLDLEHTDWSPDLLTHFHVPPAVLPCVTPSCGRDLVLDDGARVTATLSDQAAAALAVFDDGQRTVLVNLGTGAFVLREASRDGPRKPGYLFGPLLAAEGCTTRYALEGTINGSGPALDRFGTAPTDWPERDPCPEAFAVPDSTGLGSPYWRPDVGLTFSPAAGTLSDAARRRIVLEGLLFRIREILDDLCDGAATQRVILAGGVMRDPAVGTGLATLLGRGVERLLERESGLLGAARLAAGLPPYANPQTAGIEPGPSGAYLPEKFRRWQAWLRGVTD